MLRMAVSGVAFAFAAFALVSTIQQPAAWPMLPVALLLVVGCVVERRYRHPGPVLGAGFHPTAERFVDPETGRLVVVWADAEGGRRYVEEGAPSGS